MPFMIVSAVVAVLVAILAVQNSMMGLTVKTRSMWQTRKLNEQIALLEDDKRILRDKVEQLMKAQGGVMDPADTTTTPTAEATVKPASAAGPLNAFMKR